MRNQKFYTNETEATNVSVNDTDISSYERIARILICLSTGISSVTEIARECDMKVPTVHRLLKSLTKPHFTVYDAVNHRYFLGPLIAQLSSNASTNHQYLRMCALKELKRLSDSYGESITLTVLIGTEFIQIYVVDAKHELMVQGLSKDLKGRLPATPFGATQRVMLSQLDDINLRHVLNTFGTQNEAPFDMAALQAEIARIREQGYCISSGELIPGATCLSCPIENYFFPSAINIIGPKTRLSKKIPHLLKSLREAASIISETLVAENILKK